MEEIPGEGMKSKGTGVNMELLGGSQAAHRPSARYTQHIPGLAGPKYTQPQVLTRAATWSIFVLR